MGYRGLFKKSAGSFTVEAALIMPLILGVIVLFIYIPMFFFDRCTIEHAVAMACLDAVYSDGEEPDVQDAVTGLEGDLLLKWDINTEVYSDDETITVTAQASPALLKSHFIHRSSALKHFCPNY